MGLFSRKELYNLVWSKPLSQLAKEYSISDNGIRKNCKRMNIPLPINGHWQKVNYGKKVKPIKLPKDNEIYKPITLTKRTSPINVDEQIPETILRKKIEIENSSYLIIPEKLLKADVLVRDAKRSLRSGKVSSYSNYKGIVYTNSNELSIEVSPSNILRASIFMDVFIKLLRVRGHNVIIEDRGTFAVIFDEKINIRLVEKLKKVITNNGHWDTQELHANGSLGFKYGESYKVKEVKDSKSKKIEDKIALIVAKLEIEANEIKKQRIETERWHQEYKRKKQIEDELKMRKNDEKEKLKTLLNNSDLHFEANKIRDYIEKLIQKTSGNDLINDELLEYKNWALNKANWIDPLVDYEDEFLNNPNRIIKD